MPDLWLSKDIERGVPQPFAVQPRNDRPNISRSGTGLVHGQLVLTMTPCFFFRAVAWMSQRFKLQASSFDQNHELEIGRAHV